MSPPEPVLLVNPTITKARSARFPLAVLSLSTALKGKYDSTLVDGNLDRDFLCSSLRVIAERGVRAVGISVMGGPQLPSAIALSRAIRARFPAVPIIWGGHFPTNCPDAALRSPYADYAVRGQGEETFNEVLDAICAGGGSSLASIRGLSWRRGEEIIHNPDRAFSRASLKQPLPFASLPGAQRYLGRTYLGQRTAGYQAALGCRFRCTFCGVAAMFRGKTALPGPERLEHDLHCLRTQLGADSIQFYDHNFFDREVEMIPLLEILARHELPWWCFARADALLNLSERSWQLVRRSRLRMAYIGAESASDWLLHEVRKGTRSDQTLEAVEVCRRNGVTPELSFMLAPPHDPEGETERTFQFIREIKRRHPATEVMLYVYAPLPSWRSDAAPSGRGQVALNDYRGMPVRFPQTADEWMQPHWLSYWCHTDSPWLTPRLRERIRDFTTVLGCRFPTATDVRSPAWGKALLRTMASWRYRNQRYRRPWELALSKKFIRLWDPRVSSL